MNPPQFQFFDTALKMNIVFHNHTKRPELVLYIKCAFPVGFKKLQRRKIKHIPFNYKVFHPMQLTKMYPRSRR